MKTEERLIIALDISFERSKEIVEQVGEHCGFYKVGLSLFTQNGKEIINFLKKKEKKIFLDLKFHDIPHQVSKAVNNACRMGVDFLTVHALGGKKMLKAAVDAAKKTKTRVIAVTVLTSIDENDFSFLDFSSQLVNKLAGLAEESGVWGVVCSGWEVKELKQSYPDLKFIVPGVRLKRGKDDQKRVVRPKDAILSGADYLVIGRPVTGSKDSRNSILEIINSIN